MENLRLPLLAQLSAHILLHLALLIPPTTLSHRQLALTFLPAIWACDIYSWNAGLGFIATGHSLWALELLGFRNVREDFGCWRYNKGKVVGAKRVRIDDGKKKEDKKIVVAGEKDGCWYLEPYPATFFKRLIWVFNLTCSLRYIGWSTSSSSTPPSQPRSRISFLAIELLRTTLCFLTTDLISFYQHFDPYFQILSPISEPFPRRLRTFLTYYHLQHLPPQFVRILILGCQQYAVFSLLISVPSIIFVGLGGLGGLGIVNDVWGRPENWRPMMGGLDKVVKRGLRGFWGGFWHQGLRVILTGPGKALSTWLGLQESSLLAYGIKIMLAFAISSVLHVSTLPPGFTDPWRYAVFFWAQGGLVLFEVVVSNLSERLLPKRERTRVVQVMLGVLRLGWVVGVMYLTGPLIVDELTKVSRAFGLKQPFVFRLPEA